MTDFNRRQFIHGALAGAAFTALPISAFSADDPGLQPVLSQIPKMHVENVKRLQDWIALPSIAAENRNYPQGPDYMAQLARDAGFANVEIVPTSGKPGVFGTLDAGAVTTVGIYFMYDVKQFDPSEWSSPPLEGRIVDKKGLGRICVGRGAVNQKGPEAAFLGALHAFKAAGTKLPVNLVLVCEGEEEIGSTHFPEVVHQPKVTAALKKCMGVFIPEADQDVDGGIQISLGAKGVVELELVSRNFANCSRAAMIRGPSRNGPLQRGFMNCSLCASVNQSEFPSEISIHYCNIKNLNKPKVLVFPRLLICLDWGFSRFDTPAPELRALREEIASSTAA
ncbi:MAG: M20/M25/M40 family metallo-hydrolase [Candidatus Sulfotelmatobacter sp.]